MDEVRDIPWGPDLLLGEGPAHLLRGYRIPAMVPLTQASGPTQHYPGTHNSMKRMISRGVSMAS